MNFNNLETIEVLQNEFCYLVTSQYYLNSSFYVRMPKLMPLVGASINRNTIQFNNNIFVNDSSCKPSVSSSVTIQGFITIRRAPNCSLEHKKVGIEELVPNGTRVVCECLNGNWKNMSITDAY